MKKRLLALVISAAMLAAQGAAVYAEEAPAEISLSGADELYVDENELSDSITADQEEISVQEIPSDEFLENVEDISDTADETLEDASEDSELILEKPDDETAFEEIVPDIVEEEIISDTEISEPDQIEEESPILEEETGSADEIIEEDAVSIDLEDDIASVGNTFDTATTIIFNTTYKSAVSSTTPWRYYKFTLPSSGKITINAIAYVKYIYYYLYDASASEMSRWNPYWNSTSQLSSNTYEAHLTKGTYCFAVHKDYTYEGNFNFSISFSSAGESFTETGSGTNNTMANANTISFDKTYNGQIAWNDSVDFYRFTLSGSGAITINATAKMKYIYYKLYNSSGNQLKYWNPYWNSTSGQSANSYKVHLTSGTYYLACSKDGYYGNYSLKIHFVNANESFKESGNGTNNQLSTAKAISLGTLYKGQLALNDTKDFYKFTLSTATTVTLVASASEMTYIYYYIYDKSGNEIWKKNPRWNDTLQTIESNYDIVLSAGTYYFAVAKDTGYGNYNFKLSRLNFGIPKLLATYNGSKGIGIKWQEEPNADSYEIWRKYSGSWSRIATVSATDSSLWRGNNALMYTDTSVRYDYGKGYIYAVAAKRGDVSSGYSLYGLAAYRLTPPSLTGYSNPSAGTVVLKWSATPCYGYEVQYCLSSSNPQWKKMPVTTGTSITIRGLRKGQRYHFRVRCYKSNASRGTTWSEYSRPTSRVISR